MSNLQCLCCGDDTVGVDSVLFTGILLLFMASFGISVGCRGVSSVSATGIFRVGGGDGVDIFVS